MESKKIVLLLAVRSRIEELGKIFLRPYDQNNTRIQKWKKILLNNKKELMTDELIKFRKSVNNPEQFIETVLNLYKDISEIATHKVYVPNLRSRDIDFVKKRRYK